MPPNMISIANTKSIVLQILRFHESIQNWSIQQVKLAYLSTCEKLKLYGSTFFSLTNTRVRRFPVNLVLAVHSSGLTFVSAENEVSTAH